MCADQATASPPSTPQRIILVANSKGGSGKSTLSTNLAALYAAQGFGTVLVDCDPQQSAQFWLDQRADSFPKIHSISGISNSAKPGLNWVNRIPRNIDRIIVDSPGSLAIQQLGEFLRRCDALIVPVMPSAADIHATRNFIHGALACHEFRHAREQVIVVGNRINARNKFFFKLNAFLEETELEQAHHIPYAYAVLRSADDGLGLADLAPSPSHAPSREAFEEIQARLEALFERLPSAQPLR